MGNLTKEKFLLTTEALIAVLSLCLTCFSIGYAFGKDSNKK